jgi:hypothetical protein
VTTIEINGRYTTPTPIDWYKGLNSKFKADEASVYRSISIDYVRHEDSDHAVKRK